MTNFKRLKEILCEEIKVIGKTFMIDDTIYHIMGLARGMDGVLNLYMLEYNEADEIRAKQAKQSNIAPLSTNRANQKRNMQRIWSSTHFANIDKVYFGEVGFNIKESMCWSAESDTYMFAQFMVSGWYPTGLDTQNMEYILASYITLLEHDDVMPELDLSAPIRFSKRLSTPLEKRGLVEKPLILSVGEDYSEKIYFTDTETNQTHWIQINKVYLMNVLDELKKNYAELEKLADTDPDIKARLSDEDWPSKAEIIAAFEDFCPKDKRMMVIEYECEENITIDFHSKQWLDAEHKSSNNNTSVGIFWTWPEDERIGKLGMELKLSMITEPLSPDTKTLEVELFSYRQSIATEQDDIIID